MPVNDRKKPGERVTPPTTHERPYLGHSGNETDPTTGETTFNSPLNVVKKARGLSSKEAQTMANAHYAAQMANAGQKYASSGQNYNVNNPQAADNETYGTHAKLTHLGGPTGNPGPRSNGTLYANPEDLRVIKGIRARQSAVRGKTSSSAKPTGGARKKTRKHKKESRESRKLKKSRK